MWKCKLKLVEKSRLPDTPSKLLEHANESMFPSIHILRRLICRLPVTSSECECSISIVVRRLKMYLRSTVGQERMTGVALVHIKYGWSSTWMTINIFAELHQVRMLFTDILAE